MKEFETHLFVLGFGMIAGVVITCFAVSIVLTEPAHCKTKRSKHYHLSAFFDTRWQDRHALRPRHVIRVFVLEAQKMRRLG